MKMKFLQILWKQETPFVVFDKFYISITLGGGEGHLLPCKGDYRRKFLLKDIFLLAAFGFPFSFFENMLQGIHQLILVCSKKGAL